jgi:hypothetical protein
MAKLTKTQLQRERIRASVKQSKQSTLDSLAYQFDIQKANEASKPAKAIIINRITYSTKEDELALEIEFSLLPSKVSFSKIALDLYFQEQLINSALLSISQSSLLGDSLEFPRFLDMKGIGAGNYLIRVEMYELWSSGEKLNFTAKEIIVQYVPQTRAERLVKIPTVKSVAGTDLTVVSSTAKDIYREIEQDQKHEAISKRDEW